MDAITFPPAPINEPNLTYAPGSPEREALLVEIERLERREKTLRRFSRPVDLSRFDRRAWMTAEDDLWDIPEYLVDVAHQTLLAPATIRRLGTLDRRTYTAGLVGRE